MDNDKLLLSPKDVERIYGIKEGTLAKWRQRGTGPDYFSVGKLVRYKESEFEAWLESKRVKGY